MARVADGKRHDPKRGSSIAGLIAIILAWAAVHAGGWTVTGSGSSTGAGQNNGLQVTAQALGNGTGAMVVTVEGCEDRADTYEQIRYRVFSAGGRVVDEETVPVQSGVAAQTNEVGEGLPLDRYYVEATCLADGRSTGDSGTSDALGDRVAVDRTSAEDSSSQKSSEPQPRLPHSGR